MIRMHLAHLAVLLALGASGCAPAPEQRLYGEWEGTLTIEPKQAPQGDNPFAQAMNAAVQAGMQNLVQNLKARYEFRPDGSFRFELENPFRQISTQGRWEVLSAEGDKLTVRLTPDDGASMDRLITFSDPKHFEAVHDNARLQFTRVTPAS